MTDRCDVTLVTAPPRSGKTEYALRVLLEELHAHGDGSAALAVSGRVAADRLGARVIRSLGASGQARPVTTLQALAFRALEAVRARDGLSAPRLLNGAEQDAMLRRVMATHLAHAAAGDDCGTCGLLREYFAQDEWSALVAEPAANRRNEAPEPGGSNTVELIERGVSGAFVDQLRDMLARMDELGVTPGDEPTLLAALGADRSRLGVQWRLAFALRSEYIAMLGRLYPGEYRIDASYLPVAGTNAVRRCGDMAAAGLPGLLIVDDFQDTTLAGMRMLEAMHDAGARLLLIGNPDEAVQTFRGSYPEYLFRRAQEGPLKARTLDGTALPPRGNHEEHDGGRRALDALCARVSLSIPSQEEEETPIARRPGKLAPVPDAPKDDAGLATALYRSPREELDDVVWRIKRAKLTEGVAWNDMAVIAHDNATVRLFGERLRRDGVPVRYSSVTRPLKDEPFVRGLFALIELADLRRQGPAGCRMGLAGVARFVRARVATLTESPLVTTGRPGEGAPARLAPMESAIAALESLASVVGDRAEGRAGDAERENDGDDAVRGAARAEDGASALRGLIAAWDRFRGRIAEMREADDGDDAVSVDETLVDPLAAADDGLAFGADAIHVMLAFDDACAPARDAIDAICAVLGSDPQGRAFARLWELVDEVTRHWNHLESDARAERAEAGGNAPETAPMDAQQILWLAWKATGVARPWQAMALSNTADGRAANDRLDAAMRLFQFAQGATGGISRFIAQVRSLEIEADSLAHVGPVEDAVTLATPAGSAGLRFRRVWMPAVQQGVWPNLTERNTMFGGEDLAELVLRGHLPREIGPGRDDRLVSVLSSEKKGLLVALTRAGEQATLSAVWNDDLSPSGFLFGYLPERYPRERKKARFVEPGDAGDCAGLDASPRGLVAKARVVLATADPGSGMAGDAAAALALLADHGIEEADPGHWDFVDGDVSATTGARSDQDPSGEPAGTSGDKEAGRPASDEATDRTPVAKLRPSEVDRLWACPVCWLLENRFAGPRPGSVATGFGLLVHEVACRGSAEGLDLGDHGVQEVADRLEGIYRSLRVDPTSIADPRDRYEAIRRDAAAADVLGHIATYFAQGGDDAHLGRNVGCFEAGKLEKADCEQEFHARFDMDDILAAYNAVPGIVATDRAELTAMMGALVGGWPEGMDERLTVRLSGRIDRRETRELTGCRTNVRLIDYKTGHAHTAKEQFNDLQLVCYQLGLVFPEGGPRGAQALAEAPYIGQSMLFDVEDRDMPGYSRAPEGAFQPPLFVDGSLNAHPLTERHWYGSKQSHFLDLPELDASVPPQGVEEATWRGLLAQRATQLPWALTMIARVFYAAAASRSTRLVAHPQPSHAEWCRLKGVCPACAGQIDTVFETRQA